MVQGPAWGAPCGPAVRSPPLPPMDYVRDPGSGKLYRRGKLLGKGAFGRCYKFTNISNNHIYAVKVITRSRISQQRQKDRVEREIEIHSRLMHKNIVDFHSHFEDEDNIYMILEYCRRKSLAHILRARKVLTEPEVRYYMREIISGVGYLHRLRIIHRDLKLSNCFITKQMEVKIGDLGLATTKECAKGTGGSVCGTPTYLAPEVLARKGHSFQSDIWALGCIMYTLLTGSSPFKCQPLREMYQSIRAGAYTIPSHLSPDARSLIARLLALNPSERPSLSEILRHSFFTQGYTPEKLPPSCCHSTPDFSSHGCLRKFFKKAAKLLFRQVLRRDPSTVRALPRELKKAENYISHPRNFWRISSSNIEALTSVTEETQSDVPGKLLRAPRNRPPREDTTCSPGEREACGPGEREACGPGVRDACAPGERETISQDGSPRDTEPKSRTGGSSWKDEWATAKLLMKGTLNKSEADGSLGCIVGSVVRVLRCCLENMPQANQEPQLLTDRPILWVTKWVDYSNKYGFGYQWSDMCTGVLLRDGTHIALDPHMQKICYSTGSDGSILVPRKTYPGPLAVKIEILNFFCQYMEQRLLEGGDLRTTPGIAAMNPCLLHFMKSDQALLMVFSNGTVQANFYQDHTKIVLSCQQGDFLLTYINQQRLSSTMYLHSLILAGCPSQIRLRMHYMAELLQHL